MGFKVYCKYEDYSTNLSVYIFDERPDGSRAICTSIDKMEFKLLENEGEEVKPAFKIYGLLAKPFLQAFADELENVGIKAIGKPVLENELTAVKDHLADMRKIAFSQLKIK